MASEETLFDVPLYREFAGLGGKSRLPDGISILRFLHLLRALRLTEQFLQVLNARPAQASLILKEGKVVDASLAKVEHPFRVIKHPFGHVKVRYRALMKTAQQLITLFAPSNVWMVRHCL
jgi:IS5 family transposase